ncbi:glycosyltransferase CAZy family GT77 [Micractinium conductrix]|uniref:Glycosyltransferase n=1 Tax=Micractinium conductrix TaxID=554055 RepID=A0A2P6VKQ9_9CHLO|nr:glycosyltransferase CAZy family GT77 [Micractinium conductrix]|eukprot:PSC74665.1 glycosyltransferase CAZy family GT77 [Micractinium conductrix]
MAPRRGPQRGRGPLALALTAGMVVGLIIAAASFKRPHGSSGGSGGGEAVTAAATTASGAQSGGADVGRLEAQVQQLSKERDAAQAEVAKLRAAANAASSGASAGACPDRHTPWGPSPERDKTYPELAEFLKKVAINNEVLVSVSNSNYAWPGGMLQWWADNAKRAGVENIMVVALDDATKTNAESYGLPAFRMNVKIPDSQKDVGSNHAVSALKFRILQNFLKLGYSVFLSDVDIIFLQNPFDHLHRDSDVEGMSDGWDPGTAYGYNDVADDESMGWARYAHSMRIFVLNSGLFYLKPTQAATDLLDKIIYRVETENGWDQALFNECIFFPNRPGYKDPAVTRRVLDYMKFMNSKVLFKHLRHDQAAFESHKPVSVHDKFERMKAVVKRYVDGDLHALDAFPDGSQ